jgi:putative copper export protein
VFSVPDILSVICRAFAFVLSLQACGIALFTAAFGRRLTASEPGIRGFGCVSATAALVFVTAHYVLEAARMAGDLSGILDPSLQSLALLSPTGEAFSIRLIGLVLVALGLRTGYALVAVAGALVTVAAFTIVGHTAVSPHRVLLAPLLAAHLLIVAFWIGSLGSLYLVSIREPAALAASVTHAFSAVATWLVPCILLAGIGMAALLVPGLGVFLQPYGELLLVKTTLFAVLLGLAALNKWKLAPRIGADEPRAVDTFRRTVVLEYVLVCSVLTVTAVMTMFYSPEAA